MSRRASRSVVLAALLLLSAVSVATAQPAADSGWPHYGNDPGGTRYSEAAQIDRTNVAQLRVAWTYRTGALGRSAPHDRKAAF
jgi:glucose dehydrogenase